MKCEKCKKEIVKREYQSFNDWLRNDYSDSTFGKDLIPLLVFLTIPLVNILLWLVLIPKYYIKRKSKESESERK